MSVVRIFAALLLSGLLTACVAVAPGSKPVAADFDILGRVLISGEGRAFSSGLRWRHDAAGDELWLMSPVGQTLAHIVADSAGAVLTTPDLLEYRDHSVESLTRRALGLAIAATVVTLLPSDRAELHERIKEHEHRLLPKVLHEWRERGLPVWDEGEK